MICSKHFKNLPWIEKFEGQIWVFSFLKSSPQQVLRFDSIQYKRQLRATIHRTLHTGIYSMLILFPLVLHFISNRLNIPLEKTNLSCY